MKETQNNYITTKDQLAKVRWKSQAVENAIG